VNSPPEENRRFKLPKKERLHRRLAFEYLFKHGNSFRVGVLSFFYIFDLPPGLSEAPVSIAFAAPKRMFSRAVDRNHLKRRMREAYRLHKHILTELPQLKGKNLVFLVKYNVRAIKPYREIERSMIAGLKKLGGLC
jgi:ribonuclease P protein component